MVAHHAVCTVAKKLQRRRHVTLTIFIKKIGKALMPEIKRVDLRVHVAVERIGKAGIRRQDGNDIRLQYAGLEQLDRRYQHAFLKGFRGLRVVIAGNIAPHIVPVPDGGQITEDLAISENRLHQPEIGQMCAAVIGVVEDEDVSVGHTAIALHPFNHRLHGERHHPDEDRQAGLALNKGFTRFRIVNTVAGVMRLGDDRVESGPEQGRVHFIGNLFQSPFQNGKRNRIHLRRSHKIQPVGSFSS